MYLLPAKIDSMMESLSHIYEIKGKIKLQQVLVNAKVDIIDGKERDQWNNGSDGHLVILTIPEQLFFEIFDQLDKIKEEICRGLNKVNTTIEDEYICNVQIKKEDIVHPDWRLKTGLLSEGEHYVPSKEQNRIWKKGMFRLFISHKCGFKAQVARLKKDLSIFNIDCFVAHVDIPPASNWENKIENALLSMDACLAIITDDYHDSDWTDQETGCAYGRGVPVIPVKFGKLNPYGLFTNIQAITSNWEDKELSFKIMITMMQYSKVKDAFITAISNCNSFEQGNYLSKLFPHIDSLSTSQLDRLIDAWQSNSQARGSFGFVGTPKNPDQYGLGIIHYILKWAPDRFPNEKKLWEYIDSHTISDRERQSL